MNLKTGALALDPVDLDLGGGLRFTRHYASNALIGNPPSAATLPGIGLKWSHSLYWHVARVVDIPTNPVIVVHEPMRSPVPFIFDGTKYKPASGENGSVTVDPDWDVHFTNSDGTEADFDFNTSTSPPKYYLTEIRHPGEEPIVVTQGPASNETTFARGSRAIVIRRSSTLYRVGRVSEYSQGNPVPGQRWTFTYLSGQLQTVVGPDPSTPSTSDTTTWTYTYKTGTPSGRLALVQRATTSSPTPVTLGSWDYGTAFAWWDRDGPNRVISVDEQALDQPLSISYSHSSSTETLSSQVTNSAGQLLAVFNSKFDKGTKADPNTPTTGVIKSVTNATGPAAPVPGGAGVDVPFVAQTTIHSGSPLVKERTDKRGNKTLFESYDDRDRAGRVVRGWVDGPASPGVFSADDTFASLQETVWHPVLHAPLIDYRPSVLPGGGTKTTLSDYDDPSAPSDNPLVPNQAPTTRLYKRTETGYTRDATGAVVSQTYSTTFTYDAIGHLKTVSGPRPENLTEHFYDPTTGDRTATRRHLNGPGSSYLETTFSNFDSRGNPQTLTDPNGQVTTYTYDSVGRVTTVTPSYAGSSSTISFTYDVDGNLTRVDFPPDTFSQPYFIKFGYDTKNKPTHIADAAGNAIVYERTAGRVTRQARYGGFVNLSNRGTIKGDAHFDYDVAGRLIEAFNPLDSSISTVISPDANGNPEVVTDENGKVDDRLFDALDRLETLSQLRGASTYVTDFAYDSNSKLTRITDPAPKDTDYEYDDFDRLVKVTSANAGVTIYAHDAEAGARITKKEDLPGAARTTRYSYDGLDRLTAIDLPTDADWAFVYDGTVTLNQKGRLTSASNGTVTTTREYSPRGDLEIERTTIGGSSYEVEYEYDAAGNRTSVQPPSGVKAVYAYSGARAASITVNPGSSQQVVQDITFDPFGGRTQAKFPPSNSVVNSRSYNLRGQVGSVNVTSPAGSVVDRTFDYNFTSGGSGPNDPGPNLDRIVDNRDGSQSRFFFYDELDRLWKSSTLAGSVHREYLYDANGNRTTEVASGGTTDNAYEVGTDRIANSEFSDGNGSVLTYYEHDAFGNRIWEGLNPYSGTPSNLYDEQNQLVQYSFWATPTTVTQYDYDAFGRRVRKANSGGTTLYFYDEAGNLVEERSLVSSPNPVRNYVWLENEPVGIVDSVSTSLTYSWIHTDYLGMPIAVTSSPTTGNAQTIWRANYAPYGQTDLLTDPDGNGQPFSLALRFPGQYADAESSYHYNWHRYYDPSIGRYISADPIGQVGGINLFTYASNSPTGLIDPDGLIAIALAPLLTPGGAAAAVTALTLATAAVIEFGAEVLASQGEDNEGPYICPGSPVIPPYNPDPLVAPGEGYEWRPPNTPPGSGEGTWYNKDTKTSVRPDRGHPGPIGPHNDISQRGKKGPGWRQYPDGSVRAK